MTRSTRSRSSSIKSFVSTAKSFIFGGKNDKDSERRSDLDKYTNHGFPSVNPREANRTIRTRYLTSNPYPHAFRKRSDSGYASMIRPPSSTTPKSPISSLFYNCTQDNSGEDGPFASRSDSHEGQYSNSRSYMTKSTRRDSRPGNYRTCSTNSSVCDLAMNDRGTLGQIHYSQWGRDWYGSTSLATPEMVNRKLEIANPLNKPNTFLSDNQSRPISSRNSLKRMTNSVLRSVKYGFVAATSKMGLTYRQMAAPKKQRSWVFDNQSRDSLVDDDDGDESGDGSSIQGSEGDISLFNGVDGNSQDLTGISHTSSVKSLIQLDRTFSHSSLNSPHQQNHRDIFSRGYGREPSRISSIAEILNPPKTTSSKSTSPNIRSTQTPEIPENDSYLPLYRSRVFRTGSRKSISSIGSTISQKFDRRVEQVKDWVSGLLSDFTAGISRSRSNSNSRKGNKDSIDAVPKSANGDECISKIGSDLASQCENVRPPNSMISNSESINPSEPTPTSNRTSSTSSPFSVEDPSEYCNHAYTEKRQPHIIHDTLLRHQEERRQRISDVEKEMIARNDMYNVNRESDDETVSSEYLSGYGGYQQAV